MAVSFPYRLVHQESQLLETPVYFHFCPAQGASAHRRDVLKGQPLVKPQDNGFPDIRGQSAHADVEPLDFLPPDGASLRVFEIAAGFAAAQGLHGIRHRLCPPVMVPDQVEADRVKPGEKFSVSLELPEGRVGLQKSFLREIIGIVITACHAIGQVEDRAFIPIDHQGVGVSVAL